MQLEVNHWAKYRKYSTLAIRIVFYALVAYLVLCLNTLCHEWAHSLAAVALGVKANVLDIHYSYRPFLIGIDENVDYGLVARLPGWQGVLIAFAGPLVNLLFASVALLLTISYPNSSVVRSRLSFFVFFELAFWSSTEWFNYMVIRNIFPAQDIANMIRFGFPHALLLVIGILTSGGFLYLLFGPARRRFNEKFGFSSLAQRWFLWTLIIGFVITQSMTVMFFMF
jgi:hypothetical protein